jgi:hypothetical protein
MIAKSYQKMTMVDEPFQKANGKMYQKVLNETTGVVRDVRWYSEDEYYKMYPEDKPAEMFKNQRKLLGFDEGYITIFKGYTDEHEYWFNRSIARYCVHWGWYIVSTDMVPCDLPVGIEPVRLDWEKVGHKSGELKDKAEVEAVVNSLLYCVHPSTFQGSVGDRLELTMTVIKNVQQEKFFGSKSSKNTIHTFEDSCGNHYLWDTGAKNWAEGSVKKIRGTVKEHKVINSVQTTVLTRCMEVMK